MSNEEIQDDPYLIERLPHFEMPEIITEKDISRGKKFYTDVLNKRSKKKKRK